MSGLLVKTDWNCRFRMFALELVSVCSWPLSRSPVIEELSFFLCLMKVHRPLLVVRSPVSDGCGVTILLI